MAFLSKNQTSEMSIFRKYEYWIYSGKFTAIQKVSTLLMGIFSFMLLARMLGPSGFGVWGLFITISSITETARTALIRNAFIRFMHQHSEEDESSLQGSALVLNLVISTVIGLLFLALSTPLAGWLNAPELAEMLSIYFFALVVSVIFSQAEMLLAAKMAFRSIFWMQFFRQGVLLLLIAICFLAKVQVSITHLSYFYLASVISGSIIGLKLIMPFLKMNFKGYKNWLPRLWHFGKFVFGNNVCSLLFRSTDNFITSMMFGPAVSAYYNASLRIGNLVDMPSVVLADILFPKAAKYNMTDRASIKHIYEKTVGATLVFSFPALIILLLIPGTLLHLLAGEKFVVAENILRVTAFFGFTLPFLKQFGTIMDATGRPDINFKLMLFAFCINIGINLFCVHLFGVIGAAIGTAITYFILFVTGQYILYRKFGVNCINVFRNTYMLYGEIFNTAKGSIRALRMAGHK